MTASPDRAEASPGLLTPVDGKPHLFVTLDGLRGVAALAVIAFHGYAIFAPFLFPSGYLAVDFFFMLSGFVLTFAYQEKLDAGWSTWTYCKTRVIRLYPLYLVGLVLGLLYFVALHVQRHQALGDGNMLRNLGLGLLILPVMSTHPFSGTTAFPLNFPSWSIFFELLVNFGHAIFLRRRSTPLLGVVAAVSLLGMLGYARVTGSINLGLNSPENLLCLFRVLFSYVIGMLLFRLWRSGKVKVRVPPVLIAAALMASLAMPVARHHQVLQEMAVVLCLFPLLILLASGVEPGPRWRPLFRLLGQTSFAVYILHAPLLSLTEESLTRLFSIPLDRAAPVAGIIFLAILLGLAVLVDRFYDLPARTFLRNRLLPRRTACRS